MKDDSSSGPKRCEHGVDLSIRVKKRQMNEMDVFGAQVLVCGAHLSAPQSVGMGPQDGLRARRRARGVLNRK